MAELPGPDAPTEFLDWHTEVRLIHHIRDEDHCGQEFAAIGRQEVPQGDKSSFFEKHFSG